MLPLERTSPPAGTGGARQSDQMANPINSAPTPDSRENQGRPPSGLPRQDLLAVARRLWRLAELDHANLLALCAFADDCNDASTLQSVPFDHLLIEWYADRIAAGAIPENVVVRGLCAAVPASRGKFGSRASIRRQLRDALPDRDRFQVVDETCAILRDALSEVTAHALYETGVTPSEVIAGLVAIAFDEVADVAESDEDEEAILRRLIEAVAKGPVTWTELLAELPCRLN